MSALLSISDTILIGRVSIYLSSINNSKGVLFGRRLSSPYSPVQISTVTDALRFQYDGDPTDATLRGVADYLIWMCGSYGLQAQYIISGSGGGTVVPGGSTRPLPLDFIVSASSVFATGSTGGTIPQFSGWNLDFDRNNIPQNTTDRGDGSSFYNWNRDTATVTFTPALQADELVRLTPV